MVSAPFAGAAHGWLVEAKQGRDYVDAFYTDPLHVRARDYAIVTPQYCLVHGVAEFVG